jgi:O-6-methylguanine DNA methyltransferase
MAAPFFVGERASSEARQPIIIPCHRVIGANGALTDCGGGLDRKAWLLGHERSFFPLAAA